MNYKLNLIIALTIFYSSNMLGQSFNKQNTYLDALELSKIKNSVPKNNNDTIFLTESFVDAFKKIVYKYANDTELLDNPFLKGYLLGINPPDSSALVAEKMVGGKYQKRNQIYKTIGYSAEELAASTLKSVSWQASAINGMANFMAGRFKQEVLHVAIDQIFKQIKTQEDSILVKAIFPKTFNHITDFYGSGSSSYYTADLLLLRHTAQIDIEQLPKNIIKNPDTIFPKLKTQPKIKDMLAVGNYIVEYSQQGQPLDRLISILANENYSTDSTVYKILNIADLISQALLNVDGGEEIWVNPINILPITENSFKTLEIRYFYGLLYQQLIQIPEFKSYLEKQDSNELMSIAAKIQVLLRFVDKLNTTYEYIKSQKKSNLTSPEEIVLYINEINETIISFATTLSKIPEINELYVLDEAFLDISARYITIIEALIKNDYQKVIPLLLIEFGDYMHDNNVKYSRTIAFVSQLATLENAEDMEALLNSYALPIGSASIKRHSSFNISLNSYVGLTAGWETAYGTQKNQTKGNIGLSAPIGLSFTSYNGYLTPFVSFIDLGSIVNQRLNNETTSYSNLKFEHFFTPGIGLFLNCPKLPITAGFHFNYIPNLRTIEYESGNATILETNRSVTRMNFSVLVDIPLFTIYNKDKRKL